MMAASGNPLSEMLTISGYYETNHLPFETTASTIALFHVPNLL